MTAKGRIAAATYQITLRISIARQMSPILYKGLGDAPKLPPHLGIRDPT